MRNKLYDVCQLSGTCWIPHDGPSLCFWKKAEIRAQCRRCLWDPVHLSDRGVGGSFYSPRSRLEVPVH